MFHLDTGKIYRAVGLKALRAGGDPDDPRRAVEAAVRARPTQQADLDDPICGDEPPRPPPRSPRCRRGPGGPAGLPARFRQPSRPAGKAGAVLDGRDIGTVVCPDADVKLFVTAVVEARAERRHKELQERGLDAIYARVLADLKERDARDATAEAAAPLRPAADAV